MKKLLITIAIGLPLLCSAQTGGGYDVSLSTTHGTERASGGQFTLDSTIGQSAAGTVSDAPRFWLRSGFWAFGQLAPTASMISIGGRVATSSDVGVTGVYIRMLAPDGSHRLALTSPFGYFRFDEVEAGQTYILSAESSRWGFVQPVIAVNADDEISDLAFIAVRP